MSKVIRGAKETNNLNSSQKDTLRSDQSNKQHRTMAAFQSLAQALKELNKDSTVVNLTGVELRDAGVSDLAFALRKCTKVKELILSDTKLGPQAAVHLSTFLKYNKTVTRLYLQHNPGLGDKGLEELAGVLQKNKSLEVLNLAGCAVTDIGAAALAEYLPNTTNLKKLYLYNNEIGYIGAMALAELIENHPALLQELFLWDNPLTDAGLEALEDAYDTTRNPQDGIPRIQLVTGLRNEKVAKKKAPAVKRNFKIPTKGDPNEGPQIDSSKPGDFAQLRAKAQELETAPEIPAPISPTRRRPQPISLPVETAPSSSTVQENKPPMVVSSALLKARANMFEQQDPASASVSPKINKTIVGQSGLVAKMRAQAESSTNTPVVGRNTRPTHGAMQDAHFSPQKFKLSIGDMGESPIKKTPVNPPKPEEVEDDDDDDDDDEEGVLETDPEEDAALAAETAKLEAEIEALKRQLAAK